MNLYFKNSYGQYRLVNNNINSDNAINKIKEYVHKLNPDFQIYYIRSWPIPEGTMYDVGSHTEFFILTYQNLQKGKV